MSYVIAAPEMMAAAAMDLAGIGSALTEAHTAAAPPTTGLVPAAADEVSAGVAHLFSRYAEDFHGLAGRAAVFHGQVVEHLTESAGSYANAEAANVALFQPFSRQSGFVARVLPQPFSRHGGFVGALINFITHAQSVIISTLGPKLGGVVLIALGIPLIIVTLPITIPILLSILIGLWVWGHSGV